MHFQAEKRIREHHPPGTPFQDNSPFIKGNDGKFYPRNLINNYVSRFADVFRRYLGCGFVDYVFHACPSKASKDMK